MHTFTSRHKACRVYDPGTTGAPPREKNVNHIQVRRAVSPFRREPCLNITRGHVRVKKDIWIASNLTDEQQLLQGGGLLDFPRPSSEGRTRKARTREHTGYARPAMQVRPKWHAAWIGVAETVQRNFGGYFGEMLHFEKKKK